MNLFELYAKISVDDSNFKKSMENAQKVSNNVANAMKELQSPLDKAKSGFNAIAHPVETVKSNIEKLKNATESIRHPIENFKNKVAEASAALETKRNKLSTLAAGYDSAKKKVDDLTKEFNKSAKESGTSSQKTQELAKKLNEAEKEAEEAKKELDDYSESVKKAGKNSDSASNGIDKFASKLGKGIATAAKVGVAAIGTASTAIVALGKIGLEYNNQMEQYTTNFTTMLGSQEAASKKVQELKEFAASTPLSMDDLAKGTQTLLAFGVESENSTGILRQLGDIALGDADKMQRLATAFGKATASGKVTGDTVQQMIDAGWNPLIQISKSAGETMEETQNRMGAGAISVEELQAAMEAVTTGTGQFAGGMEAASHTTQGLISTLKDNARALVGEVFKPISDGLLGRVLPGANKAISKLTTAFRKNGISGMIEAAGDIVGSAIGEFTNALPNFVNVAIEIVKSLINGISDNLPTISNAAVEVITVLANGILEMLPEIIQLGLDVIVSLANGIADSLPELIPTIIDVILQIVDTLTDPENLKNLLEAALAVLEALAEGLIENIDKLVDATFAIIENLVEFLLDPENIEKLVGAALDIVLALGEGLIEAIPKLLENVVELIGSVIDKIFETDWEQVGIDIANKIFDGVKKLFTGSKSTIMSGVADYMGLDYQPKASDSTGGSILESLGGEWEGAFQNFRNSIDTTSSNIDASVRKFESGLPGRNYVGASAGNAAINIEINGAQYKDEDALAEAISYRLEHMMERRIRG